jgi:transcriptional regulator with XRE-family HTH domain
MLYLEGGIQLEVELKVDNNKLGERITSLRESKDIKQNYLADKLGLTKYQLNRYEKGNSKPDPDIIVKIADFFDVTTDFLLGHTDNPGKDYEEEFEAFRNRPDLEVWYKDLPNSSEEEIEMLKEVFEIWKKRNK